MKGTVLSAPVRGQNPLRLLILSLLSLISACSVSFAAEVARPTVFLAGDSTVASYGLDSFPLAGWGQMLPLVFTDAVVIENYGAGGTTTRSFVEAGHWKKILDQLKPGDYVFIQFGHNDQYAKGDRFVDLDSYSYNLIKLVGEVRDAKAVPVLVVPPNSGDFNGSKVVDLHKKYAVAVRNVATITGAACIDLQARSIALYEKLGKEETLKTLFMWFPAGVYPKYPDGKKDTWHFSENGAKQLAELVAEELRSQHSPLERYLRQASAPG